MDITVRREGRHWYFSDGTVLPVVSGGDTSTDAAFLDGVADANTTAVQDGFVNTPDGVMSGVDVPQQAQPPAQIPTTTQPNPETGKTFTAAEVEAIRKQERDKLYADLEKERKARKELEKADRDRREADEAHQQQLEEEARRAAEAEMDAKQLIESRTVEFQTQLAAERQQREALEATLEQERRFTQLEHYRQGRLVAEQENILPELIDLVSGGSEEEIEQSIASLQARTNSILGNVQQSVASARQGMQGVSVTQPPVGPMDTQQNQQSLSAEQIAAMTPQEYAQHRERLLGAVRQQVREQGIYG